MYGNIWDFLTNMHGITFSTGNMGFAEQMAMYFCPTILPYFKAPPPGRYKECRGKIYFHYAGTGASVNKA